MFQKPCFKPADLAYFDFFPGFEPLTPPLQKNGIKICLIIQVFSCKACNIFCEGRMIYAFTEELIKIS